MYFICSQLPEPSSTEVQIKNDFIIKSETHLESNSTKNEKSQSQTQNLIQLMDQLDPMLSWDLLGQKIIAKYSLLEDIIERTKSKLQNTQENPINFFQTLILQVDELLEQIKQMLEECSIKPEEDFAQSSQYYLQLKPNQSFYLFGNHCPTTLNLKNFNDFPDKYREKVFTQSENNEIAQNDEFCGENNEEIESKPVKKKRSRQKFSQCDKCFKSWNDIRSYELHLKEPGKCPGKPWFKVLPGKKYSCIHPVCGGTLPDFADQSQYWNHVRERHWVEEDLVVNCHHCREKFPLIEMMKYHVKLSHPKTVSFS